MIPTDFKLKPQERDPQLENLLHDLQNLDRLFEYNVPVNIRTSYDNDDLLQHLQKTYTQELFVIEHPTEVQKYAQVGERVVSKQQLSKIERQLKKGAEGVVKKNKDGDITVDFKELGIWTLPYTTLTWLGNAKWFFLPEVRSETEMPITKDVTPQNLVRYDGKEIIHYTSNIPAGANGLITYIPEKIDSTAKEDQRYFVTWAQQPGLIQKIKPFTWEYRLGCMPEQWFRASDLKLVIPNTIPFDEVVRKCIPPEAQ